MKLLLKVTMMIYVTFFAFSYYSYSARLDTNKLYVIGSDPAKICSDSGGSLNPHVAITSYETSYTYNNNGIKLQDYTVWVKNSIYNSRIDNYLIESSIVDDTVQKAVVFLESFEENPADANQFTLNYKSFYCDCQSWSRFGTCKKYFNYKDVTSTSPSDFCANTNSLTDSPIEGATGTSGGGTVSSYILPEYTSSAENYYKIWSRGGMDNLYPYVFNHDNNQWVMYKVVDKNKEISLASRIDWWYRSYSCDCQYGKDSVGLCLPFECDVPYMEVSEGVCAVPSVDDFCPDGGYNLLGSCDRSCEDIGLITVDVPTDELGAINAKQCVSEIDCDSYKTNCIEKCGNISNVKNFTCNSELGSSACSCNDDNLDDNVTDPDDIDENSTESEISNSLLKEIKDETQTQTAHIEEMSSLLYQSNENDLTRETQLNSIDGKLSDIDNSINGLNDGINNINGNLEDLKVGQDEGNGWLEDIWNKLVDIYTFYTDLQEEVLTGAITAENKLNDDLANAETVDDLDINNKVQTYLDSIVSRYTNALGFSTSYGSRPSNITVELFDKQYTVVDFSVLDEHISVIRALFLSIAYLSGFMMLLRKD